MAKINRHEVGSFRRFWSGGVFVLAVAFLANSFESTAWARNSQTTAYFGVGALGYTMFRGSGNQYAGSKTLGSIYPEIGIGGDFQLFGSLLGGLSIAFTPLGKSQAKSSVSTQVLAISLPLKLLLSAFEIKAGPGVMYYFMSGQQSGAIEMANGTSTSMFGKPGRSATARLLIADVGVGIHLGRLRLDIDALIGGLASSRRTVSGLLQLGYSFF